MHEKHKKCFFFSDKKGNMTRQNINKKNVNKSLVTKHYEKECFVAIFLSVSHCHNHMRK